MPPDFWPSFGRALFLCAVALSLNRVLLPSLAATRLTPRWSVVLWAAIMAPFLTPPLLTAYAYTKPFLHLSRYPWLEEGAYQFLVFFRVYPLALLAGHCLPRRLSAEAAYCHRLLDSKKRRFWHFRWRHLEPIHLVTALIIFLYAFHEFEMASLLQRPAWTVAIFDAQTQGYALGDTWRRLWSVVFIQVALIVGVLALLRTKDDRADARSSRGNAARLVAYVSVAACVITLVPVILILTEAMPGLARLPEAFSMHMEVWHSLSVAFVAATLAYLVARRLAVVRSLRLLGVILLPGLLGTLLLSLSMLSLVQLPGFVALRDRPLPLMFGLALSVLPILTLLHALARRREFSEAGWNVTLSSDRRLRWAYIRGPHLGIWACGFYLAYFEVTTSAILAPASMTPVMVRLYNLMHYGRDTMLSAYVLVVVAAPLIIVALATALGYGLTSRRG